MYEGTDVVRVKARLFMLGIALAVQIAGCQAPSDSNDQYMDSEEYSNEPRCSELSFGVKEVTSAEIPIACGMAAFPRGKYPQGAFARLISTATWNAFANDNDATALDPSVGPIWLVGVLGDGLAWIDVFPKHVSPRENMYASPPGALWYYPDIAGVYYISSALNGAHLTHGVIENAVAANDVSAVTYGRLASIQSESLQIPVFASPTTLPPLDPTTDPALPTEVWSIDLGSGNSP